MNRVAKAAVCVCVAVRASAAAAGGAGEGDGSSFASGLLSVARAMAFLHARAWPGPSWRQLSEGAMRGMAQSVDDWSDWLAPEEEAAEAEAQEGRRVGAGLRLRAEGDSLFVVNPVPGSPAAAAGAKIGDEILAVGEDEVRDVGPDAAIDLLDGDPGSVAEIRVRRADGSVETLSVRLAGYDSPTVSGACLVAPGIGYAAIEEFGDGTAAELRGALSALGAAELDGLVLDLRDNPGGVVEEAVSAAALFLPRGATVLRTSGRVRRDDDREYRAEAEPPYPRLPLAILADGCTASAAEIFCGALREAGRAFLVGSRTFGKGVVQDVFDAPGRPGSAFKLTVASCITPGGDAFHGRGFEPDVPVRQTDAAFFDSLALRMARSNPELVFSATDRARLLAVPDAPLEAALERLRSGAAPDPASGETGK